VLLSVLLRLLPREPLIVLETDSQLRPGVGLVLVRVLVLSVVLEQAVLLFLGRGGGPGAGNRVGAGACVRAPASAGGDGGPCAGCG
jgi:hypothetical protein